MLASGILATIGALVILTAIGFGPALWLTSKTYKRRMLVSAALGSAIGVIITAFLSYILSVLGVTIQVSALPLALVGVVVSALLVSLDWRARPVDYREALRGISGWTFAAFGITGVGILFLLFLPAIVGGIKYQSFAANINDGMAYTLMAFFGRDFPIRYSGDISHYAEILQHNPLLVAVMTGIANLRPAASHILAWQSVLFNQTPLLLYYFSKLLGYMVTAGVAAALGYQLGLRWWQHLGLMVVSAVGFWAIFVSDIDALSQVYSIPLSLLLLFAFIQFERERREKGISRHRLFLALGLAGVVCFYVETALILLPTLGLYYIFDFLFNPSRSTLRVIRLHSLTIILTALLLNVMLTMLIPFAQNQVAVLSLGPETRDGATWFFPWLFSTRPPFLTSLWGFYYLEIKATGVTTPPTILSAMVVMGLFATMVILVGSGVLKGLTSRIVRPESRLLALLITTYWGGGLLLYVIGNDWIAGKSIAMGAPFMVVGAFVFLRDNFSDRNLLNGLLQFGLMGWVVTQALILPIRALTITNQVTPPPTVPLQYRPILEIVTPIVDRLQAEKPTQVGFDVSSPKSVGLYFLGLFVQEKIALIWFSDGLASFGLPASEGDYWLTTLAPPSHLIVADERDYLQPLGLGKNLITVDAGSLVNNDNNVKSFAAYAVKPQEYDEALYQADILNPDIPIAPVIRGMDAVFLPKKGGQFARWMTNDSSELHFISSANQPLGIYLESRAQYNGDMTLDFNGTLVSQFVMKNSMQTQSNGVCVAANAGSNVLKFTHPNAHSTDVNRVLIRKLLFAPVDRLDVGAFIDTRQMGVGWQAQENWGEETIRWAEQDALLQIMTCDIQSGRELHFRAYLPSEAGSQNVTVQLNGTAMGTIDLSTGWKEYTLKIADGLLKTTGLQTIELHHSDTFVPSNDTRVLSAAYDHFWFTDP